MVYLTRFEMGQPVPEPDEVDQPIWAEAQCRDQRDE